jgi:hypothetical protein
VSQDYTVNSYQADHVGQVNLANIEKNLECLRSFFSGASAPSNAVAGHAWFDTAKNLPKIRNDANNAWLAILTGTTSQKLWIYRNDTDDGWAIDSGVTDRVISLKGGSGAYDRTGGGVAGETWDILKAHVHTGSAHTHSHNHKWYNNNGVYDSDETYNSGGAEITLPAASDKDGTEVYIERHQSSSDNVLADSYTNNDATARSGASNTGAQSTADVRPAAAVGTLQYPDI